jgi:hypothetical protein
VVWEGSDAPFGVGAPHGVLPFMAAPTSDPYEVVFTLLSLLQKDQVLLDLIPNFFDDMDLEYRHATLFATPRKSR